MRNDDNDTAGTLGPKAATGALIATAASEGLDLHSILVQQGGDVLAEAYQAPFDAETPHRMYSVTKSFVSTAVGLVIGEGRLSVEDRLVDLFPELVPADRDAHREALAVKHLLTMSSGHLQVAYPALSRPGPSLAAFIAAKPAVAPGSRYDYSNDCSYALAAIVERITGMPVQDYLRPRLLEPLEIAVRPWLRSEEGITNGGSGLHLTTRELSRFGQMLLQRGMWKGQQLVPAAWIDEATGRRVASWGNAGMTDWTLGYGYQYWRGRHDSFRCDGLLGQFCVVLPALDALVVTTAGTMRTQRLLELIWEIVVPALRRRERDTSSVAPAFADAVGRRPASQRAAELSGLDFVFGEPFVLPTRFYTGRASARSVGIRIADDAVDLIIADERGQHRLRAGTGNWAGGTSPLSSGYPEPYRGRASWTSETSLAVEMIFTEAAYRLRFEFDLMPSPQVKMVLPVNPGLDGRTLLGRPFP